MNRFLTDDRKLEQFLFAHDVPFDDQTKDDRGHTIWHYAVTQWLLHVILEYYALCERRSLKKEDAYEQHDSRLS